MTIQAVVFDWAGTTVDYGSRAPIIAFQRAFARFGIGLSEATIRTDVGLDKIKHVEKILKQPVNWQQWQTQHPEVNLEAAVELVYAQFQTEVAQVIGETAILKPGMKALINYLNQHHLQIATTSGYTESMVAQNLKMTARQGYQPEINITSEQTDLIGRPQAAMLNLAMKKMHIDDPQTVIKIGDTVNDILEGKNAHTISVGVVEGSNVIGLSAAEFDELSELQRQEYCRTARKTFEDAGADFTVDTMADLIPLIDQLNMPTHETAPLLLTPGPLTTSESVKQTMMVDHGTWDDDYKQVTWGRGNTEYRVE
ncbi:(2-aminoethyl)phosphonate--pyruvate aminotransferase [Paucilactobacillus vaccinostercus DSM 20634]|uniref:Phosphonoacetaldehyde hydrolase n=1 Tax=Paucilactobacillus vaccinostercus DSM 20634 TaxID=1423813 RepID=A0A0R2A437_9LACO|nr:(2-aminoethyl)phosphonate--pyruvate aminotransferase [Paucilactobacillus vaccinostercus DSM 20634]